MLLMMQLLCWCVKKDGGKWSGVTEAWEEPGSVWRGFVVCALSPIVGVGGYQRLRCVCAHKRLIRVQTIHSTSQNCPLAPFSQCGGKFKIANNKKRQLPKRQQAKANNHDGRERWHGDWRERKGAGKRTQERAAQHQCTRALVHPKGGLSHS